MNQSLLNPEFDSYILCRQQSQCYLLIPPPQPPILPKLILTKNLHQQIDSFFIIFIVIITLISTCLLLFLLDIKYEKQLISSSYSIICLYIDFNFIINYDNVIIEQKMNQ